MRLEYPCRREMRRPEQSRLVGIIADDLDGDLDLLRLQDHRGAADGELADPAAGKAPADHQPLHILPALELEEAARHQGQFLGEGFDCALDDARRFGIAIGEQRIEAFLREHAARLVAERVVADLAQRLAPAFDELAERAFAGAVADEALVILELDIVSLDLDRGQHCAAVPRECRSDECLISHFRSL